MCVWRSDLILAGELTFSLTCQDAMLCSRHFCPFLSCVSATYATDAAYVTDADDATANDSIDVANDTADGYVADVIVILMVMTLIKVMIK